MAQDRLADRAVLVTGAGRGIGAAIARLAAAQGAAVGVNDLDPEPAAEVAEEIRAGGGRAVAVPGNIADWATAGAIVGAVVDEFGALDGLVANAGVFGMALPQQQDPEEFRRILEINVLGVAWPGLHAIRHMTERGRGSVVTVTSSAIAGLTSMGAYGASKGAVASMTLGWALDLQGTGVRVNALSPIAQTRMQSVRMDYEGLSGAEREAAVAQRTVEPEFNAPAAVHLLSDRSAPMTGQIVQIGRGNRLDLLTHHGLVGPGTEIGPTIEDVERAFAEVLDAWAQPIGLHRQGSHHAAGVPA
ncbi:SDR family NAD(P)-dependent oxidoreductase [Nakamurella leprariae]|uniref:SDR family oxidoreductase n=1 Tax=Nakamurella leprariae TaxID=2803911 RepID=A0A939C0H4_9ACTN|nr:SDR family oxidoreductase [Nakamurella leprariae]MBM9468761.1 SDR family oxidoreductase [Nakamurella leprariae]